MITASLNRAWVRVLTDILTRGWEVWPRGMETLELPQETVVIDMRYPVLTIPGRKLSYQFMAAEAYWILSGDNSVAGIAPWNAKIANYSDDGETFFGAYGPKVVGQLGYVLEKLRADEDTRQAGLTIWRENPGPTKDVPCTVAIFANIRSNRLHLSVFMRSSDAWLGLPYDAFNFSMLAHHICAALNKDREIELKPGNLYLTAASLHLYAENFKAARDIVTDSIVTIIPKSTPENLFKYLGEVPRTLEQLRDSKPGHGLRWWE